MTTGDNAGITAAGMTGSRGSPSDGNGWSEWSFRGGCDDPCNCGGLSPDARRGAVFRDFRRHLEGEDGRAVEPVTRAVALKGCRARCSRMSVVVPVAFMHHAGDFVVRAVRCRGKSGNPGRGNGQGQTECQDCADPDHEKYCDGLRYEAASQLMDCVRGAGFPAAGLRGGQGPIGTPSGRIVAR